MEWIIAGIIVSIVVLVRLVYSNQSQILDLKAELHKEKMARLSLEESMWKSDHELVKIMQDMVQKIWG